MISPRKSLANARNAARSTGPRSTAGKARSKLNAVSHGLRAVAPVLPGEDAAQWEAYRAAVVAELRACGTLETELATRVASVSWRLRRVPAYEVASATAPPGPEFDLLPGFGIGVTVRKPRKAADVAADLAVAAPKAAALRRLVAALARLDAGGPLDGPEAMFLLRHAGSYLPDEEDAPDTSPDVDGDGFLAALGVPEAHLDAPEGWAGWTPDAVKAGLTTLAASAGWTAERLRAAAATHAAGELPGWERQVAALEAEAAALRLEAIRQEVRTRQLRTVPAAHALDAIIRYEPHLSRQLADALDTLERVQAARQAYEAS